MSRLQLFDNFATGLNVRSDEIIEIACIITDGNLKPVDEGISFVIKTEKAILDK